MRNRLYILLLLLCIISVAFGTVVLALNICEVKMLLCRMKLIKTIVLMLTINTYFSYLHELGHVRFAKQTCISCSSPKISFKCGIPTFYIKYSKIAPLKNIDAILFLAGGSVIDSIICGIAGGLFIYTDLENILLVLLSEVGRLLINLLPIGNNDGRKIVFVILHYIRHR